MLPQAFPRSRRHLLPFVLLACGLGWLACGWIQRRGIVDERFPVDRQRTAAAPQSPSGLRPTQKTPLFWPQLYGPDSNCFSSEPVLLEWDSDGPPVLWECAVGEGYSSPIVYEDRLVFAHRIKDEEHLECRNVEDGEQNWLRSFPTNFVCESTYSNGPYSTPTTDGELLYALSAAGVLRCLTLADGADVWDRDLRVDFGYQQRSYGAGQGLLLWQDLLIVNVGGTIGETGIVAFERRTGRVRCSATNHAASYATPLITQIHGHEMLFVLTYEGLVALAPQSGEVYWEFACRSPISNGENAVTPLIVDDLIIVCSYGNGTYCLRISPSGGYEIVWEGRRQLTSQYTPVVHHQGYLYGVHCSDHTLRCIELNTGKLMWRKRTPLKRATCIHQDSNLLLLGEFGHLASLRLDPDWQDFRSQTADPIFNDNSFCFSSPALSAGRLFVRNEYQLKCLDLRSSEQK